MCIRDRLYVTGSEGTALEGLTGTASRVYLGFDSKLVLLSAADGRELTSITGIPTTEDAQ